MELALFTDSVSQRPLAAALDLAVELDIRSIEIAAGGQSPAPHLDIGQLLSSRAALQRFQRELADRQLHVAALNCSAWPLHPTRDEAQQTVIRQTIELAGLLDVRTIVSMSGCPGDTSGDTFVNWVWYPWPPEAVALLERQWEQVIALWQKLAQLAAEHGVERIALELHPLHLVYNVPTLLRLREAVGPIIGANLDPSHFFWQQMDPIAAVSALRDCLYHVHLKDSQVVASEVALSGVLDNRPFSDPSRRAWVFRTVGRGHDATLWSGFLRALSEIGYRGALSIENEDVEQPQEEGVREAADFVGRLLGAPAAHEVA